MTTVPADPDVGRCPICHGPLPSRRASYCSAACRIRAHRQRHAAPPRPLQQRPAPTPAEGPSSVRLDLLAAQVSALAGQVAELAAVVAQLTEGRESQSPPPVGGEAVERGTPPASAREPEPLDPGPGAVETPPEPKVAGEKRCRRCGGPLPNARAVFCSRACREEQVQEQVRTWEVKHGRPYETVEPRCPVCDRPLRTFRQKFCSPKCRQVSFRERHGLPGSAWEGVGLPADGSPAVLPPGPPPKLAPELVPEMSWGKSLYHGLAKTEWDRVRHQVFAAAGGQCEICGGRGKKWPLECHERWRYDDARHIQYLDGLIALCPNCHHVQHLGFAKVKGWFDGTMYHLQRVNGWDHDTTVAHANAAFAVWAERTQHEWTLDASAVESQFGLRLSGKDHEASVVAPAPRPSLPPDPAYESASSAIGTALDLVLGPNAGKVLRVLATSPHTQEGLVAAVEAITLRPPPTGSTEEQWKAAIAAMREATAPAPVPLPEPVAVEAGSTPSVWAPPDPVVLGLWPVGRARGILADLDRTLTLTEAELAEHLKQRGIPRPMFDNYLKRQLAKWLELAKVRPADPREAMAALAAELRDALEPVLAVPAPLAGGGLPPD